MFDSYTISQDFKCPDCGLLFTEENDFQTKDLACILAVYKLGDIIDPGRRWVDFYSYCDGRCNRSDYDKPRNKDGEFSTIKATCKNGYFYCRVFLDIEGKAIKEEVTMYDKIKIKEIPIYQKEIK